jgi:hypothetical protein
MRMMKANFVLPLRVRLALDGQVISERAFFLAKT